MINYHIERYAVMKDGAKLTIAREATMPENDRIFRIGEAPLTHGLGVFLSDWSKMESEYKKALKNDEKFRLFFYASNENGTWCQGREFTADEAKTWNDNSHIPSLLDLFAQVEMESEKK